MRKLLTLTFWTWWKLVQNLGWHNSRLWERCCTCPHTFPIRGQCAVALTASEYLSTANEDWKVLGLGRFWLGSAQRFWKERRSGILAPVHSSPRELSAASTTCPRTVCKVASCLRGVYMQEIYLWCPQGWASKMTRQFKGTWPWMPENRSLYQNSWLKERA